MAQFRLRKSEKLRDSLTKAETRQIREFYQQAWFNVQETYERIEQMPDSATKALQKARLRDLEKQLKQQFEDVSGKLTGMIQTDMETLARQVLTEHANLLTGLGVSLVAVNSNVPNEIVKSVLNGKVYEGNWHFSRAIWGIENKAKSDVSNIVAMGIAENKSAINIAKDLEKYVSPKARKSWNWSHVYPGVNKQVDYNAARLSRTLVNHAYQQTVINSALNSPFCDTVQWISSHDPRVCPICNERDGKHFAIKDVPLDHPNGRCALVEDVPDLREVAARLRRWTDGENDPAIDKYMKYLGFKKQ